MADRSSGEHATAFVVEDMTMDDLEAISWSGSPSHIRSVAMQLERRDRGEVDYLVVRGPDGAPVCKGSIDWQAEDGAIGQKLVQVGIRVACGLLSLVLGVNDGDG